MSTTQSVEVPATRTLYVRARRLVVVPLLATAAALTLAACGVLGGNTNHGAAPVELAPDPGTTDSAAQAQVEPGEAEEAEITETDLVTSAGVTVTKIGVRTQVKVNTATEVRTAIKTQETTRISISVPPAVTNTQTETVTETVTATRIVTENPPAVRVTVTRLCPATGCPAGS